MYENIRQAGFAGQYYPSDAKLLQEQISEYLAMVGEKSTIGRVKAIIAPHAGYEFSGRIAAVSLKELRGQKIGTAVIICNSHAEYFNEIAIDNADAWQTPLGTVGIDKDLASKLIVADETIQFNGEVFGLDQTLEVQLPFLQSIIEGDFKILPVYFGNTASSSYQSLTKALVENMGDDDVLVISTDMSHYPAYEEANRIDQETLKKIKTCDIVELEKYEKNILSQQIVGEQTLLCGIDGVKTAMAMAKELNWQAEIIDYANSGDAIGFGDTERVVGYGAMVFIETENRQQKIDNRKEKVELSDEQKEKLLNIAKQTVENFVRNGKISEFNISDERLNWQEGAFVTLKNKGQLRGCIGQILPIDEPLFRVVRDMAIEACSQDYRFNPVSEDELPSLEYEISVLSAPEKIDNWQDVELGKHGVIIKRDGKSGVFLPQVADETGWSREEFLSQLCWQKAGLEPDCYKDKDTEILVFTAQVF